MTTSESKGRFFLQNESIRIDSNRELECSTIYLVDGECKEFRCHSHVLRNVYDPSVHRGSQVSRLDRVSEGVHPVQTPSGIVDRQADGFFEAFGYEDFSPRPVQTRPFDLCHCTDVTEVQKAVQTDNTDSVRGTFITAA